MENLFGGLGMGVAFTLEDKFTHTSQKIQKSFTNLDMLTEKASKRISQGMNRITQGTTAMIAGAALLAPFAKAVSVTIDFESQMSSVGATARATAEELKLLTANAIEMGSATKFSALEAAQAQEFLALAGFKVNDIMAAMPGVLNVAAATNTDLATTADIASDTLTALGLKASDMTALGDAIALTTTTANTNLYQLGEALKYSAASIAKVGGTKNDLLAILGMMGDIGLKGSIAGTSLNQAIEHLIDIPFDKKKQNALVKLGLSNSDLIDAQGNLLKLTEVFPKIANAAKKIQGNVQRGKILTDIFGIQGQRTIDALMTESGKNFEKYVDQLENSSGTAIKVAKQKLDNLKGDLTILASSTETTLIKIGAAITPFLRPIISGLGRVMGLLGAFANTKVGQVVMILVASFGMLLVTFGALNIAMGASQLLSVMLAQTFIRLGVTSVGTAFATGGLTAGFYALATATWAAITPMLPFIAMGALFIAYHAALYYAIQRGIKSFETLTEKTTPLQRIFARLGGVFIAVKEIWNSFNKDTGEFTLLKTTADKLRQLGILDFVLNLSTWITRLKLIFVVSFEMISKAITKAWGTVKYIFSFFSTTINYTISILEDMGIPIAKLGGSMKTWMGIAKAIGTILSSFVAVGILAVGLAAAAIVAPVVGAFSLIMFAIRGVGALISNIYTGIKGLFGLFISLGAMAISWGSALVLNLLKGVQNSWSIFSEWIKNKITSIPLIGRFIADEPNTVPMQNELRGDRRQADANEVQMLKLKAQTPIVNNSFNPNISSPTVKVTLDGTELYGAMATIADNENQKY